MRDPAMAALMGAIPGPDFGQDYAEEYVHGIDAPNPYDVDFGISVYDASANLGLEGAFGHHHFHGAGGFGHGFGLDAPPPTMAVKPHPAEVAAAYANHSKMKLHTEHRETLLDPNRHSVTKVERYSFSLTNALVLNVASALANMTLQPNTTLRPQRVVMNAPTVNFVTIASLLVANVNVFVGGLEDAFTYSATAMGIMLDLPTLQPANRATVTGNYTGFVPPGFANNFAFTFIVTLQGPSTIAGGSYQ
jgi:hypothetical protein